MSGAVAGGGLVDAKACGPRSFPMLSVWRCSLPVLASALLGACLDERRSLGLSVWLTLCRSRSLGTLGALLLQARLLPTMMWGMGIAIGVQLTLAARAARADRWSDNLCGVAGCLAAMLASAALCPLLLEPTAGQLSNLLAMLSVETVCGALAAAGVAWGWGAMPRSVWRRVQTPSS